MKDKLGLLVTGFLRGLADACHQGDLEAAQNQINRAVVAAFLTGKKFPAMVELQMFFDSFQESKEHQRDKRQDRYRQKKESPTSQKESSIEDESEAIPEEFRGIEPEKVQNRYVGVYPNGSGFRARLVDRATKRRFYGPTRRTELRAAYDRLSHLRTTNQPANAWETWVTQTVNGDMAQFAALEVTAWINAADLCWWDPMPDEPPASLRQLPNYQEYKAYDKPKRILMRERGFAVADTPEEIEEARDRAEQTYRWVSEMIGTRRMPPHGPVCFLDDRSEASPGVSPSARADQLH